MRNRELTRKKMNRLLSRCRLLATRMQQGSRKMLRRTISLIEIICRAIRAPCRVTLLYTVKNMQRLTMMIMRDQQRLTTCTQAEYQQKMMNTRMLLMNIDMQTLNSLAQVKERWVRSTRVSSITTLFWIFTQQSGLDLLKLLFGLIEAGGESRLAKLICSNSLGNSRFCSLEALERQPILQLRAWKMGRLYSMKSETQVPVMKEEFMRDLILSLCRPPSKNQKKYSFATSPSKIDEYFYLLSCPMIFISKYEFSSDIFALSHTLQLTTPLDSFLAIWMVGAYTNRMSMFDRCQSAARSYMRNEVSEVFISRKKCRDLSILSLCRKQMSPMKEVNTFRMQRKSSQLTALGCNLSLPQMQTIDIQEARAIETSLPTIYMAPIILFILLMAGEVSQKSPFIQLFLRKEQFSPTVHTISQPSPLRMDEPANTKGSISSSFFQTDPFILRSCLRIVWDSLTMKFRPQVSSIASTLTLFPLSTIKMSPTISSCSRISCRNPSRFTLMIQFLYFLSSWLMLKYSTLTMALRKIISSNSRDDTISSQKYREQGPSPSGLSPKSQSRTMSILMLSRRVSRQNSKFIMKSLSSEIDFFSKLSPLGCEFTPQTFFRSACSAGLLEKSPW